MNGETFFQGALVYQYDTAWLYNWTVCYGLVIQVGRLIRPGSTSGLFDTVWLYKWAV